MIETERLILRDWRDADIEPLYAMSIDPAVMATLGPLLTREETAALIERNRDCQARNGFTFWATERRADRAFLGLCGLKPGAEGTPIEGELEIGWRLGSGYWGQGYAREAAQAVLDWAWDRGFDSASAITTPGNPRSWGLMERLGMTRAPKDDFDHPKAIEALKAHVTYRIARPAR